MPSNLTISTAAGGLPARKDGANAPVGPAPAAAPGPGKSPNPPPGAHRTQPAAARPHAAGDQDPPGHSTTDLVNDYLTTLRARSAAAATIQWYSPILRRFADHNPIYPTRPEPWERWLADLAHGLTPPDWPAMTDEQRKAWRKQRRPVSAARREDYYRALAAFARWATKRRQLPYPLEDVHKPIRRRKMPRYYRYEQLDKLFHHPDHRVRAAVRLFLDAGPRCSEAYSVTQDLITIDEHGQAWIHLDGKTGERQVPITAETARELTAIARDGEIWRQRHYPTAGQGPYAACAACGHHQRQHRDGPCTHGHRPRGRQTAGPCACHRFVPLDQRTESPLSKWGFRSMMRRAMRDAGLTGPKSSGPHVLRHSFGRQYIKEGGDVFSLQRILGHANVSTTMVYALLDDDDTAAQHAKFSPIRLLDAPPRDTQLEEKGSAQ